MLPYHLDCLIPRAVAARQSRERVIKNFMVAPESLTSDGEVNQVWGSNTLSQAVRLPAYFPCP